MPEPRQDRPQDETEPYVPASPVKRILAWTGVAYMVIFVLLNLYPFFRGGEYLRGVGPLLVCPGCLGLGAVAVWQLRQKECASSRKAAMLALASACAVVLILGLLDGLPALVAGLGGHA